jgi:hypothetical protein
MKSIVEFVNESRFVNEAFKSKVIAKLFNSSDKDTADMMQGALDWDIPLGAIEDDTHIKEYDSKLGVAIFDIKEPPNAQWKNNHAFNEFIGVIDDKIMFKIKRESKRNKTKSVVLHNITNAKWDDKALFKWAMQNKARIYGYDAGDNYRLDTRTQMQKSRKESRDVAVITPESRKLVATIIKAKALCGTATGNTADTLLRSMNKILKLVNATLPTLLHLQAYDIGAKEHYREYDEQIIGVKVKSLIKNKPISGPSEYTRDKYYAFLYTNSAKSNVGAIGAVLTLAWQHIQDSGNENLPILLEQQKKVMMTSAKDATEYMSKSTFKAPPLEPTPEELGEELNNNIKNIIDVAIQNASTPYINSIADLKLLNGGGSFTDFKTHRLDITANDTLIDVYYNNTSVAGLYVRGADVQSRIEREQSSPMYRGEVLDIVVNNAFTSKDCPGDRQKIMAELNNMHETIMDGLYDIPRFKIKRMPY